MSIHPKGQSFNSFSKETQNIFVVPCKLGSLPRVLPSICPDKTSPFLASAQSPLSKSASMDLFMKSSNSPTSTLHNFMPKIFEYNKDLLENSSPFKKTLMGKLKPLDLSSIESENDSVLSEIYEDPFVEAVLGRKVSQKLDPFHQKNTYSRPVLKPITPSIKFSQPKLKLNN